MSSHLIAIVGVIYAGIAIDQFARSNPAMGIVYAGYAFSNVGLWVLARPV
jgi:hypothetical protein